MEAHPGQWTDKKQITDSEVFDLLKQQSSTKFVPGSHWAYSNSGYVVLGLVVKKISGQDFGEFLHERIFAPLRMDHTLAYEKGKNEVQNRAYGHTREGSTWRETDQSSTSATLGDGGVYTSLEDLAKWDAALRSHTLLSAKEMQPAITPVNVADHSVTGPDNNFRSLRLWLVSGSLQRTRSHVALRRDRGISHQHPAVLQR